MLRLLAPLFGFAVFGALFTALYYDDPQVVERNVVQPKFRLAPEAIKPDFIEPVRAGENITVTITVLSGEVHVYLMDMENLSLAVQNFTSPGFSLEGSEIQYNETFSRFNITEVHEFTFVSDGINRWAVVFRSAIPLPDDYWDRSEEERDNLTSEVGVTMRYIDREEQSLLFAYIMSVPSVLLVMVTLGMKMRRRPGDEPGHRLVFPRDKGL